MPATNTSRLTLAALLALVPGTAMASGFYIIEQSPKAAGRAYSGEVADTGPESLWWNPAAVAGQKGLSGQIGASAILPSGKVNNASTLIVRPGQAPAAVGGDQVTSNPINKGVVPTGSIAYGLNDKVALSLTIAAPYNFTTDYPTTSWARYSALKTSLRTFDIQPGIAVEVIPGLRVGAALNVEYAKAELGNALPNLSPLLADGSQKLQGNGWDLGYSAGFQFGRGPVTIGASYKSSVKHVLKGTVTLDGLLGPLAARNGQTATTATFNTPWQAIFGVRYALSPAITLNAQATASGWSKFDAIRLGSPLNTAIPENYRDSWAYAVGVDAKVSPKWTLRAGVMRDLTPVRGTERDARVPDSNRWMFALGASHQFSPRATIDVGVNYLTLDNAPINRITAAYAGTAAQTPVLVNGTVTDAHVLILALGGRFSL
jgi:long-chain fatty acid transport protein